MKNVKTDIDKQYRRSITFDMFLSLIVIIIAIVFLSLFIDDLSNPLFSFIVLIVFVICIGHYILSDIIFKGRSLGKRIFGIVVRGKNGYEVVSLWVLIHRRILELTTNPLFVRPFSKRVERYDRLSNSTIKPYELFNKNKDL